MARKVADALGASSVAFVDMDAYYNDYSHLPMEERRRINWDHPNSFDWELLLSHLRPQDADHPVAGNALASRGDQRQQAQLPRREGRGRLGALDPQPAERS